MEAADVTTILTCYADDVLLTVISADPSIPPFRLASQIWPNTSLPSSPERQSAEWLARQFKLTKCDSSKTIGMATAAECESTPPCT